jgi:S1-C subfamily serine protease
MTGKQIMKRTIAVAGLIAVAVAVPYVLSKTQLAEKAPEDLQEVPVKRNLSGGNIAAQVSEAMADAVEGALPSVVVIQTGATRVYRDWWTNRRFYREEPVGQGSGVVISEDGYILTNRHVIERASKAEVVFNDGTSYPAKYIGSNSQTDIAVLKIEPDPDKPLTVIEQGDSDAIRVGELVMAIGSPYSLSSTVTHGVVSQKGRASELLPLIDFIQTSAPINPGNSGGALVDVEGHLIGINTYIQTADGIGGSIGLGFAVPAKIAFRMAELIIKGENSDVPYIGLVTEETPYGIMISEVIENGPAMKAGLEPGISWQP